MLVQKWAILRSAMPMGIAIKKTIGLVIALMKLHNFCINEVDRVRGTMEDETTRTSSAADSFHFMNQAEGFVPLDAVEEEVIPTQLLGAGNHFDDIPRTSRYHQTGVAINQRPRMELHEKVINSHKVRPSTRIRG